MPPGPLLPDPLSLAAFWQAYNEIDQERGKTSDYDQAAAFWASFDEKMRTTYSDVTRTGSNLKMNAEWGTPTEPSAAATAFHERMDAGVLSIRGWLNGGPDLLDGGTNATEVGTGAVQTQFRELINLIDGNHRAVVGLRGQLEAVLGVEPVARSEAGARIELPQSARTVIDEVTTEARRLSDDLRTRFAAVQSMVEKLPDTTQWSGPTMLAGDPPPGTTGPGSPAGAPPGGPGGAPPGGPGGAPPGGAPPGGPGGAPPGGPGAEPPGAPGTEPPGGPGSTPDTGAPGAEVPGADTPGAELPGGTDMPELPPTDPSLSGTPTATLPPPSQSPSTNVPSFTPSSLGSSPGSQTPFTPLSTPFSSGAPVRGAGPSPTTPRGSTVDGPGGVAPGGPVTGEQVPRTAAGGGGGSSTSRPGFFPPMMPMMPPPGGMGGGAGGGVKPGEAEFAGGPTRHVRGRDSLRAGLRSQLLGRTGEYDDDPEPQPRPPAGGEVLDEELWRVPDAAPVSPPEPPSRRGRSW